MKKVPFMATCFFLFWVWIPIAVAGTFDNEASQDLTIQPQTSIDGNTIIPPKAGISWKEKVMMWREIKERGLAERNRLIAEDIKNRKKKENPVTVKSPMDY